MYMPFKLNRVGSRDTVLNHPSLCLNLIPVGLRGGWEMSSITRMFEYITLILPAITVAGKVLASVKNPFQKVCQPRLVFLIMPMTY